MEREGLFTVIVRFDTTAESRSRALEEIGDYVAEFLSRQDGFVQSWLQQSVDGDGVVHVALWRSEAHFAAAGEKAQSYPALPALRRYNPRAERYQVWRAFGDG